MILYVKWVWLMGVAYNIRRGFGVGLPVPEISFEKLGPMWSAYHRLVQKECNCRVARAVIVN